MRLIVPRSSKADIDRAGALIAGQSPLYDFPYSATDLEYISEYARAHAVVDNWRSAHSYPLHSIKMILKQRARSICPQAVVAQRLKRFASIRLKLRLAALAGQHPHLSQMQDIGGCRAVLETLGQVKRLESKFLEANRKNPHRGAQHSRTMDYIAEPKVSGYRSLHLVYRYRTSSPEHSCFNGQRIEIQLRTKLQHYWATAVETYSTFTGEAMKSSIGSEAWKRFFALSSSLFAHREGCPTVPLTSSIRDDLRSETKRLYESLNVFPVLTGWSQALQLTTPKGELSFADATSYLLVLDPAHRSMHITPFSEEEEMQASEMYQNVERKDNLQAVLVSVDSMAALRSAFPNYYLDTSNFIGILNAELGL